MCEEEEKKGSMWFGFEKVEYSEYLEGLANMVLACIQSESMLSSCSTFSLNVAPTSTAGSLGRIARRERAH